MSSKMKFITLLSAIIYLSVVIELLLRRLAAKVMIFLLNYYLNYLLIFADSTVLAHVLTLLNEKYDYGLDLFLLSIDEGITGYRDDSLEV